jgi:Reverse transcriptase (RNA-dependent DNA polymerase)
MPFLNTVCENNRQNQKHKKIHQRGGKVYNTQSSNKVQCWYHKTPSHNALSCNKLWAMSGKDVVKQAKEKNICIKCAFMEHNGACQYAEKLNCKICDSRGRHRSLNCPQHEEGHNDKNFAKDKKSANHFSRDSPRSFHAGKDKVKHERDKKKSQKSCNHAQTMVDRSDHDDSSSEEEDEGQILADINATNERSNNTRTYIRKENSSPYYSGRNNNTRENTLNNYVNYQTGIKKSGRPHKFLTQDSLIAVITFNVTGSDRPLAFLLDTGSSVSLIEDSIARSLKAPGHLHSVNLTWTGDTNRSDPRSRVVELFLYPRKKNSAPKRACFHSFVDLRISPQKFNAREMYEAYPYLKTLELHNYFKVAGIIGADNAWAFDYDSIVKPPGGMEDGSPIGYSTPYGDFVIGCRKQVNQLFDELADKSTTCVTHYVVNTHTMLDDAELELMGDDYHFYPKNDRIYVDEQEALDMLKLYTKRLDNGRYQVPILFKDSCPKLPKSLIQAARRWRMVALDASKKHKFEELLQVIYELFRKNYATIIEDERRAPPFEYYHPMFFLIKPGRVRPIWDFAAKNGFSCLNDYIFTGPNLYNEIVEIICKFRQGDLVEMFHQILISPEHRPALRFVFSDTPDGKLKIGQMNVMPFGSSCSPVCSQYVLKQIAASHAETNPRAALAINTSLYVDDFLRSYDDPIQASKELKEVRAILRESGFTMAKLNSNYCDILQGAVSDMSESELANSKIISMNNEERLLGYVLNLETDTISVNKIDSKLSKIRGSVDQTRKLSIQLGRNKRIPKSAINNFSLWKQHYMNQYKAEEASVVTRAAHDVAAINQKVDF